MSHSATAQPQAVGAFDQLAEGYDELFTKSLIGRAQRNIVWNALQQIFKRGDHILELNCGTGEDALFLGRNGVSVFACDASKRMVQIANQRLSVEDPDTSVQFSLLPTERLREIGSTPMFDGAFSNFSGLNCVADLTQTAEDLANLLPASAPLLICLSTRFCISEIVWFLLHGEFRKAFRRCSGQTSATVGQFTVDVYYPTVRQLRKLLSPFFVLQSVTGIGVTVPPSYVEIWIRRHPRFLGLLRALDAIVATRPGFRVLGDHMLLRFERVRA
jgi:SAM-dependent methyltransferase